MEAAVTSLRLLTFCGFCEGLIRSGPGSSPTVLACPRISFLVNPPAGHHLLHLNPISSGRRASRWRGIYRILVGACWGLGFLSLIAAVALKLMPRLTEMVNTTPRGGLIFASALFLCALATREMERLESPTS